MKSDLARLVFVAMALTVCGALEELLPKFLGVGFPFLLAMTSLLAADCSVVAMSLLAVAAGAFEDSLSSLPLLTSPCFFLLVAVVIRRTGFVKVTMAAAYPLYQVWLAVVAPGANGGVFGRLLVALPFGLVTLFVVTLVLVRRKEVIGEA